MNRRNFLKGGLAAAGYIIVPKYDFYAGSNRIVEPNSVSFTVQGLTDDDRIILLYDEHAIKGPGNIVYSSDRTFHVKVRSDKATPITTYSTTGI